MKIRVTAPWLVLSLSLAGPMGCGANSGLPTASDLLAGAHASLEQDDTKTAEQWLASARSSLETDRERKEFELLAAELDIRTGEAELALPAMSRLLESYPDDPRVHELAGKTRFQLGEFAEAGRHFGIAQNRYRDEEDVGRATDLVALARGFEAYARGRMAEAKQRWGHIKDRALRASVFDASVAAAPADGGGQGVLARSDQTAR
ncbi:MAG: tetratricopeptide repeat protein [Planctomycetota bacterium]|jgi:Flp pilus assembly protein TadD